MPDPLEGLRKAKSISAPSPIGNRPYGSVEGQMRGEMPLGPFGGGIRPGGGKAVAPAIEALKDIYRNFGVRQQSSGGQMWKLRGSYDPAQYEAMKRAIDSPIANASLQSMSREGPEKYLTGLADQLENTQQGETLTNHIIQGLFPVFFGK